MNNKKSYNKPAIEILEIKLEGVIAQSPSTPRINREGVHGGGISRSKEFWDENE